MGQDQLNFTITAQRPGDDPAIEALLDRAFGPNRFEKTAYRLREGVDAVPELSLIALLGERVVGTIRFWPIDIVGADGSRKPALLLGPLAVEADLKGKGIGISLMVRGLELSKEQGHDLVILVGDFDYYNRVGFKRVPHGQLNMPGPVDLDRLLALELVPGSMDGVAGDISRPS